MPNRPHSTGRNHDSTHAPAPAPASAPGLYEGRKAGKLTLIRPHLVPSLSPYGPGGNARQFVSKGVWEAVCECGRGCLVEGASVRRGIRKRLMCDQCREGYVQTLQLGPGPRYRVSRAGVGGRKRARDLVGDEERAREEYGVDGRSVVYLTGMGYVGECLGCGEPVFIPAWRVQRGKGRGGRGCEGKGTHPLPAVVERAMRPLL